MWLLIVICSLVIAVIRTVPTVLIKKSGGGEQPQPAHKTAVTRKDSQPQTLSKDSAQPSKATHFEEL
jgi:hypothetical protein